MAQRYIENYPVSEEIRQAVSMWSHALDCLETDPEKLDTKIDWIIKRKLIRSFVENKEIS